MRSAQAFFGRLVPADDPQFAVDGHPFGWNDAQPMIERSPEILLLDDQLIVRRGIELLLRDAGFRIAGLGSSAEEAAGLLDRRRFDVALVEAMLDGASSAPLLTPRLAGRPGLRVVVYAGVDAAALEAAVALRTPGLVLKSSPPAVLLDALRAVAAGGRYVDSELARRLPDRARRPARVGIARLSPRERQILGLLASGLGGSEIAGTLFLSSETVRTHVRNAVQKLGARTRTQAVAMLVEHGAGMPDLSVAEATGNPGFAPRQYDGPRG